MSKTIQEKIQVMQHYANGGMIEIYSKRTNTWNLVSNPSLDWANSDYRIKEQKKTITIEKWLVLIGEEDEYKIIETSNIESYRACSSYEPIKMLDKYEVEL